MRAGAQKRSKNNYYTREMKAENCSAIIRFFYLIECITYLLPTTTHPPPLFQKKKCTCRVTYPFGSCFEVMARHGTALRCGAEPCRVITLSKQKHFIYSLVLWLKLL